MMNKRDSYFGLLVSLSVSLIMAQQMSKCRRNGCQVCANNLANPLAQRNPLSLTKFVLF